MARSDADFNQDTPVDVKPVYTDAGQERKRLRWVFWRNVICRNPIYRGLNGFDTKRANSIMNAVWPFPKDVA